MIRSLDLRGVNLIADGKILKPIHPTDMEAVKVGGVLATEPRSRFMVLIRSPFGDSV